MQGLPAEKVSLPWAMQGIPGIQGRTGKGCGGKAEENCFDSAAMPKGFEADVEGDEKVMPDREKVIKGLGAIREFFGFGLPSQSPVFEAYQNILTDAISMLKEYEEQNSIYPICTGGYIHFETPFVCPKCATPIFDDARFCSGCGRPVLWEGR